jgi:FtsZ-binding cell division protein ZapB
MSNALVAIDSILVLTQLSMNIQQAINEINMMAEKAKMNNRDFTDEEVQSIQDRRKSLMDKWNSL